MPTPADRAGTTPNPEYSHQDSSDAAGDERRLALRVVTMPRDTNPYGTIFGGVILSYIDQAGWIEASRHSACTWVTASMDRVDFFAPVHLGDVVNFYTNTQRLGTTSITVGVEVEAQRRRRERRVLVTRATVSMVAIGRDGKPTPFREAPPAQVILDRRSEADTDEPETGNEPESDRQQRT